MISIIIIAITVIIILLYRRIFSCVRKTDVICDSSKGEKEREKREIIVIVKRERA